MAAIRLGRKVEALNTHRNKIRKLEDQVKALKSTYTEMQEELMDEMEKHGLYDASGKTASVHLKETEVANVKDWDKVYNYIKRHNAFHLMFRRIADGAYREEKELARGKKIPGIESFTKRSLNLRALSV